MPLWHISNNIRRSFQGQRNNSIQNKLYTRNPKKVRYGSEIISVLSPKIWALIPQTIKMEKILTP